MSNSLYKKLPKSFQKRWKPVMKRLQSYSPWALLSFAGGILIALALVFGLLLSSLTYYGVFGEVPGYFALKGIRNHTASEVYSADGVLLGKYYIENRQNADLEEITPLMINALVATEDARFFEHSGIDFRAWMRVLVKSILLMNESAGGGSTLSQQLAKNLFPREDYLAFSIFINKIKEMIVARRLEQLYTKEELLRLYLNTVPFSENVFGIKVAARRFFNTSTEKLKVEEAAILVGMLKGTTIYNPVKYPERAVKRRNIVISQMAKYGYLSPEERDSLIALPLDLQYFKEGTNLGIATYFREQLRQDVQQILKSQKKKDGTPYNLYTDGLKIYTTLDAGLQRYAEEAVNTQMAVLQRRFYDDWKSGLPWGSNRVLQKEIAQSDRYKKLKAAGMSSEKIQTIFDTPVKMTVFSWKGGEAEKEMSPLDSIKYYLTLLNTGLLAADPQTGAVKAWVGGINHKYFQYDHVKSRRQVGSTFKPVVYAAALQSGMLPCEYTPNRELTYAEYEDWQPKNADGEYGGVYSMTGALSGSVNAVSVEVALRAGLKSVADLGRAMGVQQNIPEVPSIALGAVDASLQDMVRVYATLVNGGLSPELYYLDRIETPDGKVLVNFKKPDSRDFKRSLEADYSAAMIQMLEKVVDEGTGRRLRSEYGLRMPLAGKTGTTQNQTDGWFLGFTPRLVVGAWVGADNPAVHFRSLGPGQGAATALPIWGKFMSKVAGNSKLVHWTQGEFPQPSPYFQALLECPPYLDDMPFMDNTVAINAQDFSYLQQFFSGMEEQELYELIRARPQRGVENMVEYAGRLQRIQDRWDNQEEKIEKLKNFWNKVFFSGSKNNNNEQ